MIPATLTVTSVLTDAATVVSEFDSLIMFIVSLGLGISLVTFIVAKVRKAR